MDFNQLVKLIKMPLSENDLVRVCDLADSELNQYQVELKVPDRAGMQRIADFLERDACNLYIAIKGMHPLVYWDGAVYVELLAFLKLRCLKTLRKSLILGRSHSSV